MVSGFNVSTRANERSASTANSTSTSRSATRPMGSGRPAVRFT